MAHGHRQDRTCRRRFRAVRTAALRVTRLGGMRPQIPPCPHMKYGPSRVSGGAIFGCWGRSAPVLAVPAELRDIGGLARGGSRYGQPAPLSMTAEVTGSPNCPVPV
jgi:hypothetical protein